MEVVKLTIENKKEKSSETFVAYHNHETDKWEFIVYSAPVHFEHHHAQGTVKEHLVLVINGKILNLFPVTWSRYPPLIFTHTPMPTTKLVYTVEFLYNVDPIWLYTRSKLVNSANDVAGMFSTSLENFDNFMRDCGEGLFDPYKLQYTWLDDLTSPISIEDVVK